MQPRLLALKSAVPPHILNQADVSVRAALFESPPRCALHAGVRERRDQAPLFPPSGEWYSQAMAGPTATRLHRKLGRCSRDHAGPPGRGRSEEDDIDAIVVSSTTGIATPSLDALVVENLVWAQHPPPADLRAGLPAGRRLTRAAEMATAIRTRVLFLTVEPALTFRKDDISETTS